MTLMVLGLLHAALVQLYESGIFRRFKSFVHFISNNVMALTPPPSSSTDDGEMMMSTRMRQ